MDLDPKMQRRVWQRVYAGTPKPSPQPRQALAQCRRRAMESLRFYESRRSDPVYGPAYERLAQLVQQEIAMLDRIQ